MVSAAAANRALLSVERATEAQAAAISLNQQVEIDGEVWVAEGPATPAPLAPRTELLPTLEAKDRIQKSGEYVANVKMSVSK